MAWTKKGKMRAATKKQQAYLNKYEAKIYAGDRSVPTYYDYLQKEYNKEPKKKPIKSKGGRVSIMKRRSAANKVYEQATGRKGPYK